MCGLKVLFWALRTSLRTGLRICVTEWSLWKWRLWKQSFGLKLSNEFRAWASEHPGRRQKEGAVGPCGIYAIHSRVRFPPQHWCGSSQQHLQAERIALTTAHRLISSLPHWPFDTAWERTCDATCLQCSRLTFSHSHSHLLYDSPLACMWCTVFCSTPQYLLMSPLLLLLAPLLVPNSLHAIFRSFFF